MPVLSITADAQREATDAAIDAVSLAAGEVALALEPDDPRGLGLRLDEQIASNGSANQEGDE